MYYARVHRIVLAIALLASSRSASAGIEDWQLNEVLTSASGDTDIRYIELFNAVGGCLFATSRIHVYDSDGANIGSTALVATTTCYDPGTYFLLATPQANAALSMNADHLGVPQLPIDDGQVCFSSTSTRHDCVRWGTIGTAVTDLIGTADTTSTLAPPDSQSLARIATTHVVMDDWQLLPPTPHDANDGVIWTPPDAGPMTMPDAGLPVADAGVTPDAPEMPTVDAAPPVVPDATPDIDARNQRFLDLDPAGGAACGCRVGHGDRGDEREGGVLWLLSLTVGALLWRRLRPVRASTTAS